MTVSELGEAAWTARDLYSVPFFKRGDRASTVEAIRALVAHGMTHREIAAELGFSRSTVRNYLNDPDGAKQRARRVRYQGECERCGAPTDGSNGRDAAPTLCARCEAIRLHEQRYWTRPRIVACLRVMADLLGRSPAVSDVNRSPTMEAKLSPERVAEARPLDEARAAGLRVPGPWVVQREFGSWANALAAAGLPPNPPGGQPLHRGRRLRLVPDASKPTPPPPVVVVAVEETVCPSCGEFVKRLDVETGWCRRCAQQHRAHTG